MKTKTRRLCLPLIMTLSMLVTACGGGSGGSFEGGAGGGDGNFGGINDESLGGVWEGTFTSSITAEVIDILGVITESGEVRLITGDGSQLFGDATVRGSTVSGELTGETALGFEWLDGSPVASFSISGTVTERSSFSGSYSGAGDIGTFSLEFDPVYDRDSSLDNVEGTWVVLDALLNIVATFVVDPDGTINGNDIDGCVYAGDVAILDSEYNVYGLGVDVANCTGESAILNGSFDGLGVLSDEVPESGENDLFTVAVNNPAVVITLALSKL